MSGACFEMHSNVVFVQSIYILLLLLKDKTSTFQVIAAIQQSFAFRGNQKDRIHKVTVFQYIHQ